MWLVCCWLFDWIFWFYVLLNCSGLFVVVGFVVCAWVFVLVCFFDLVFCFVGVCVFG